MRCDALRLSIGSMLLAISIFTLSNKQIDAADAIPDNEFKTLVGQDAKHIQAMIELGGKGGTANISKASRAIKASSIMLAAYAQSRMKGGAADAQLATLRDTALKIAAAGKNFKTAAPLAKTLAYDMTAAAKANSKKMTYANMVSAASAEMDDLMFQFKKTTIGGLGIEAEIKEQCKKSTLTAEQVKAIGQRVLIVADYCDVMVPAVGFNAKNPKANWDGFNADMKKAATELVAAADKKGPALQKAFDKLDRSCVACHDKFK